MTNINNSFKPMLSPKEMLQKGIFGGTYFNKLVDYRVFPKDWFLDLDQSYFLSTNYNKKINYFESNLTKIFKPFFFKFFFEVKIHAWDFKISPSFKIRRLLLFIVSPVELISVIKFAEPVKG